MGNECATRAISEHAAEPDVGMANLTGGLPNDSCKAGGSRPWRSLIVADSWRARGRPSEAIDSLTPQTIAQEKNGCAVFAERIVAQSFSAYTSRRYTATPT